MSKGDHQKNKDLLGQTPNILGQKGKAFKTHGAPWKIDKEIKKRKMKIRGFSADLRDGIVACSVSGARKPPECVGKIKNNTCVHTKGVMQQHASRRGSYKVLSKQCFLEGFSEGAL